MDRKNKENKMKLDTREEAIFFLEDRAKEEVGKEHNFSYEIENCLWYIERGNKCEKCAYGEAKKNSSGLSLGPAQCTQCSENYELRFVNKESEK